MGTASDTRWVFTDIIKDGKRSIIVSSHLLGELQKVATHYGIIRHGKMIVEMTADELDASCRTYVALTSAEMNRTKMLLGPVCSYDLLFVHTLGQRESSLVFLLIRALIPL